MQAFRKIELESATLGKREFSLEHASRVLRLSGTWQLPANSEYTFNSYSLMLKAKPVKPKTVKKETAKVKPKKEAPKIESNVKKETTKQDVPDSTSHIGDTAATKQDADDKSGKTS